MEPKHNVDEQKVSYHRASMASSWQERCFESQNGSSQKPFWWTAAQENTPKKKWAYVVLYSLSTISGPVGFLKSSTVTFCRFSLRGPKCKSTITWSAGFASTILTFSKIPHNTLSCHFRHQSPHCAPSIPSNTPIPKAEFESIFFLDLDLVDSKRSISLRHCL